MRVDLFDEHFTHENDAYNYAAGVESHPSGIYFAEVCQVCDGWIVYVYKEI